MSDTAAEDWIISFLSDPSNLSQDGIDDWPWEQANITEVLQTLLSFQYMLFTLLALTPTIVLVFSSVGLIASILSLWTLWHKVVVKRRSFYICIFLISFLNLIFCVVAILVNSYGGEVARGMLQPSASVLNTIQLGEGIQWSISMGADCLALGLTIYRYFVICHSSSTVSRTKQMCLLIIGSILTSICVLGRFIRFGFQDVVIETKVSSSSDTNQTAFVLVPSPLSETNFFSVLVELVDFIFPFSMLIAMLYFAIRIAWTMEKRRRSQIVDQMQADSRNEIEKRTRSMLRLLFVLIIFFITNQFGYCLFAVVYLRDEKLVMSFNNTGPELANICQSRMFLVVSSLFSDVVECFDRGLTFFVYLWFNPPTRKQFKKAAVRVYNCK